MNNYLEELAVQNSNRANELGIENIKFKKRIDEAIEYIKQGIYCDYGDRGLKAEEDLLKILKGEENE